MELFFNIFCVLLGIAILYIVFNINRLEVFIFKTEEDPDFDLSYREFIRKYHFFGGYKDDRKKK